MFKSIRMNVFDRDDGDKVILQFRVKIFEVENLPYMNEKSLEFERSLDIFQVKFYSKISRVSVIIIFVRK